MIYNNYSVKWFFIMIVILIIGCIFFSRTENFNTEAIQNLSSMYNKDNINVTNLKVTGAITSTDGVMYSPTYFDSSTPQDYNKYGAAAAAKFKISEPVGTTKNFIFYNGGFFLTYVKNTTTTLFVATPVGWSTSLGPYTITTP